MLDNFYMIGTPGGWVSMVLGFLSLLGLNIQRHHGLRLQYHSIVGTRPSAAHCKRCKDAIQDGRELESEDQLGIGTMLTG